MSGYKVEDLTLEEAQKIVDDAPEGAVALLTMGEEWDTHPAPDSYVDDEHKDKQGSTYYFNGNKAWVVKYHLDDVKAHINRIQVGELPKQDIVKNPSHYQVIEGVETINIIAASMTVEMFKGYCLGNIIKYRMRAGNKDKLQQEIDKANFYKVLFEDNKHLCRGE